MKKNIIFLTCIMICGFFIFAPLLFTTNNILCVGDTVNQSNQIYLVYDNENNLIYEGNKIYLGDKIITKNLEEYEITFVDDNTQTAIAEYNGYYTKPKIKNFSKGLNFSNSSPKKSVGLYMTHNDESYVPTDGYSSIYGEGGIHDVAKELKAQFEDLNYIVTLNETLHLPHNSSAYSRSEKTAKTLLENNPDALFDIHRDGVSRSVYVKNINGVDRCKIRIVVGQANPNKEANLQFAMYLVSVAEEYCPWLFLDIYYAKGHYNQALTNKGLLFEMGTYLAEKELVLESTKFLAQIVDKTLFSTIVEEDNSITITDEVLPIEEDNLVNNVLNVYSSNSQSFWSKYSSNIFAFSIGFIIFLSLIFFSALIYKKKLHNKNIKNLKSH